MTSQKAMIISIMGEPDSPAKAASPIATPVIDTIVSKGTGKSVLVEENTKKVTGVAVRRSSRRKCNVSSSIHWKYCLRISFTNTIFVLHRFYCQLVTYLLFTNCFLIPTVGTTTAAAKKAAARMMVPAILTKTAVTITAPKEVGGEKG
jgi:hypothetical protein